MTDAANDLTSGATTEPGPYLLATFVRGMFELAVSAGLDRAELLRRIEVDEATLSDPHARVLQEAHIRTWEAMSEVPNADALVLSLVERIRFDVMGVVGWAMMNSPVAGDIIRLSVRYQALFGDPIIPTIDETPEAMIVHRVFEPRIARTRVATEYAPASTVWMIRELTGLRAGRSADAPPLVREVWFQHAAPADPSAHERFFDAPVRWSAPETRLELTRAGADLPILRRNPELYAYLEQHARALEKTIASTPTTASRVRRSVVELLKGSEPTPAAAARQLGLSERTLQRRLKDEGRTFAEILDEVRRELAVRYLSDPSLAIFEIAFMLGYAETSSFHRAFKRWTNEGPADFRARLRGS